MSDPRKAVVVPKVDDEDISRFGTMILAFISMILVLVTLPFSLCYCVKVVQEYERAVIFRLGRLKKGGASGPGLFFILPCIDKYSCVDLRTVSYEVPPQEMLSRDSVTVSVDAVCFYKVRSLYHYHHHHHLNDLNDQVSNPLAAVCNVGAYMHSTNLLVATSLRNVLGTKVTWTVHGVYLEPSQYKYTDVANYTLMLTSYMADSGRNSLRARNDQPSHGENH